MNSPRTRARIIVRSGDPRLLATIVERLRGVAGVEVEQEDTVTGAGPPDDGDRPALTPRETEVLGLLADGLSNKEIAFRLGITAHTAKFHVDSLLHKLSAVNRADAVARGIRAGLIGL
jgi:DNA-binding CsgD family transcriptional regulator